MDTKISKHANDIIQKYTSSLFRNAALAFYGIKTARVKELINVDLPMMEVSGSSSDIIFLLEDDSYLHFEFQTTYNEDDLIRFAGYDLRLFARDRRTVHTAVIYTADVKKVPADLDIGSLAFHPDYVMMKDYNGNDIYAALEEKLRTKQELTDTDMLNLIFLPLMQNTLQRNDLAVTSIQLAQTIPDTTKRNACIASVFAFASKYLNENDLEKLREVLKMTDLAVMFIEEGLQEGIKRGMQQGMQQAIIETARNAIKEGAAISFIQKITGLPIEKIQQLQKELDNE